MEVTTIDAAIDQTIGTSQELGKDDFLTLMVAQMQNQDPLNPLSNEDFLAQLAQFSSLEQMQNLNQSFSDFSLSSRIGDAVGFIGSGIDYVTPDLDGIHHGTVNGVEVEDGDVWLVTDAHYVSLTDVVGVGTEPILAESIVAESVVTKPGTTKPSLTNPSTSKGE